jgi:acetyl esterase/lipase
MKSMPAGAAVDMTEFDIPDIRKLLANRKRLAMTAAQTSGVEGITIENLTIPARDGWELPIRTYKPHKKPESGSPLALWFHGGGFCLGGLDGEELNCRTLAQKLGVTVVNVDYRLAPEHPFPHGIMDAWDALKWAAEHGTKLGADLSQGFITGGISAGANLAAILSIKAKNEKLFPPLTGCALLMPVISDRKAIPEKYRHEIISYEQNANAPILPVGLVDKFIGMFSLGHYSMMTRSGTSADDD